MREIGKKAFYSTSLTEVQIPASLQSIGYGAFCKCKNLQRVTFAEGSQLREFGDYAFSECVSLKRISLPESIE